jgi:hypothetical protein
MWTEWDSNLGALLPYEIVALTLAAPWVRLRTLVMAHLVFLFSLSLLVLLFDLDGRFGDCLLSKWRIHDCLLASSRRSWFEPFWVGTIWAFVAAALWLTPELGRAR